MRLRKLRSRVHHISRLAAKRVCLVRPGSCFSSSASTKPAPVSRAAEPRNVRRFMGLLLLRKSFRAEDFFLAVVLADEQAGGPLGFLDQLQALLGAEDGHRLCQTIAVDTAAGHHRHAELAKDADARFWIDNVRITLAGHLDVLPGVSGGR